ncbi:MAG: AMP-binding protein [Rhodospirillaceae bacterium]|jgi:2-aminobenzoate-CoA ligase|nr:AMP-binding protein [Rhodospirillaceae bacterium]MBT4688550.1 AMP-binding protein [Rhodospirillaceae bacterium]MBT5082283.1 AMP-binding protein [Rhodospirillaceae bacterium]MBT5526802.1 AMP-binding protein [Rhodospirillaceae bacterium]MBT5879167.1 AMP-binding protein [Rhodospirillaceae bacterium]
MSKSSAPGGPTAHEDHFAADNLPPISSWPDIDYSALPALAALEDRINCATALLDKGGATYPDRVAVFDDQVRWSYRDLLGKANQIAHVLVDELGVRPGNRVLLRSANNPMYAACWFAVMKAGAIAVATMPLLRARELSYMADFAQVRVALCDGKLLDELNLAQEDATHLKDIVSFNDDRGDSLNARMMSKPDTFTNVDTAADDVCIIAFTSGTTGPPKACMHFHRDVMAVCLTSSGQIIKPSADDIFTGTPPLAFTYGLGGLLLFPLAVGASVLLVEGYMPDSLIAAVNKHKVSILFTAPTMYRSMTPLMAENPMPSLRICNSAGEALPKPTWDDWYKATGLRIHDGIGATEMLHTFIAGTGEDIRPGATGRTIPGFQAQVLNDQGERANVGEVGRLAVRGPTGCRYMANPERQAGYVKAGWNLTGDSYLQDEEGYFWYQARTDDLIISAGYNISGAEIEAVLLEHEDVADCAVIASPDPRRGHVVKAYVVLQDANLAGPDLVKTLQDHVKATIAPYKYPRAMEFIDALPRTATGKVQRFALRELDTANN